MAPRPEPPMFCFFRFPRRGKLFFPQGGGADPFGGGAETGRSQPTGGPRGPQGFEQGGPHHTRGAPVSPIYRGGARVPPGGPNLVFGRGQTQPLLDHRRKKNGGPGETQSFNPQRAFFFWGGAGRNGGGGGWWGVVFRLFPGPFSTGCFFQAGGGTKKPEFFPFFTFRARPNHPGAGPRFARGESPNPLFFFFSFFASCGGGAVGAGGGGGGGPGWGGPGGLARGCGRAPPFFERGGPPFRGPQPMISRRPCGPKGGVGVPPTDQGFWGPPKWLLRRGKKGKRREC